MELHMFKSMLVSAAPLVVAGAALTATVPAQAQGIGIEVSPRGLRAYEDRQYRPVVERRERRIVVQDDDEEVCPTEIRKRRTASGSVITRRIRVCE